MTKIKIGIIGGTGLDDPDIIENKLITEVNTPFGKPSDSLIEGQIRSVDCVLLARHGRNHSVMPSNVNYRANIWALKESGCTHVLVTNACGSLKETIRPGDIVFIDQFIDRTTKRQNTFYDGHVSSPKGVCHIPMHTPFCTSTRKVLTDCAHKLGYKYHSSGTIVVIEGPRFSTRAESNLYRKWDADLVGMTTVPEVVLAKEIGLCYASIGTVTDYDCWHHEEAAVCVDNVMKTFNQISHKVKEILLSAIPQIAAKDWSSVLQMHADDASRAVMH